MSLIFVMQFGNSKKYVKSDDVVSMDELISLARKKFPEIQEKKIYFVDENNISVEDDYITEYLNGAKYLNIKLEGEEIESDSSSLTSTLSLYSSGESGNEIWNMGAVNIDPNSVLPVEVFKLPSTPQIIKPRGENINIEALRKILCERSSNKIFEEYNKIGFLSTPNRKIMINILVDDMIEKYGNKIPTHIKEEYAESIIKNFPKLKDPCSPKGYEAFYNGQNHDGFLAWRLKTVNRQTKKRSTDSPTSTTTPKKIKEAAQSKSNEPTQPNEDTIHTIEEMKLLDPHKDKSEIFAKMKDTFPYRRTIGENILQEFPRLIDTEGLIEQDFGLLHPMKPTLAECFPSHVDKILDIYKNITLKPVDYLCNDDNELAWNKETSAILAILHMLPPTANGRKGNRLSAESSVKKLISFKKTNVPFNDILAAIPTVQPHLIAEGQTKNDISTYHVCIDGQLIKCGSDTALEAFDLLFMTHFVFDVKYDESLRNFWKFIETFFYKIDDDFVYSPKMRELRSRLL